MPTHYQHFQENLAHWERRADDFAAYGFNVSDARDLTTTVGSRTEIFLKTAVFPHTSPRHNFNDCINELESLGVRESDRRNAEKAVLSLPAKINSGVRSPETVGDLIAHYRQHELTLDRKAFATVDAHTVYIKNYVNPKWGACKLSEVKTVAVEQWLESLPLAPASQSKIRNIMSAIFSHGISTSGLRSIGSAKFAALPNACGNRTCLRQRSSKHCCLNFRCVSR
jgi:hypothetical protein